MAPFRHILCMERRTFAVTNEMFVSHPHHHIQDVLLCLDVRFHLQRMTLMFSDRQHQRHKHSLAQRQMLLLRDPLYFGYEIIIQVNDMKDDSPEQKSSCQNQFLSITNS